MSSGRDRPFYAGKHTCRWVNVQVIADPAGRPIWASPAMPGARHDMGAAREHGIVEAINTAGVQAVADTADRAAAPRYACAQRRRRLDIDTGRYRLLSRNQREVNTAHTRRRGPGERANAELKSWKISATSAPVPAGPHPRPGRSAPDPRGLTKLERLVPWQLIKCET